MYSFESVCVSVCISTQRKERKGKERKGKPKEREETEIERGANYGGGLGSHAK